MSDNRLPIDDPRLTAFALGELDPNEAAEFETILDASPGSRGAVDEIRELAGLLAGELRQEKSPALRAEQRAAILQAAAGEFPNGDLEPATEKVAVKSSPAPQTVGGGQLNGKWGRRFASVMTVAAMIMVAVMLLPSKRPGFGGGAHDRFFSEYDGEGLAAGGGGGMGLAFQWNAPNGLESKFNEFNDHIESFSTNGQVESLSDEARPLAAGVVDGTRATLRGTEDFGTTPENKPGSMLMSRSFRQQSDNRAKQLYDSPAAGDEQSPPVSGPISESLSSVRGYGASVADRRSGRGVPADSTPAGLKSHTAKAPMSRDQRERGESNSGGRRQLGASEARAKAKSATPGASNLASKPDDSVELESTRDNPGGLGGYGPSNPKASRFSVANSSAPAGGPAPADDKSDPKANKESQQHHFAKERAANGKGSGADSVKGQIANELRVQIADSESPKGPFGRSRALAKKMAREAEPQSGDGYANESGRISREEDEVSGKRSGGKAEGSRKGISESAPARGASRATSNSLMPEPAKTIEGQDLLRTVTEGNEAAGLDQRESKNKAEQKDRALRSAAAAKSLVLKEESKESDSPVDFDVAAADKKLAEPKSIDKLVENQRSLETVRRRNAADSLAGDDLVVIGDLSKAEPAKMSLAKKVTANFEKAPLQEVVKELAELGEFRYVLDPEGLTQQGISPQTPVTLNVDSVPAEVALEKVLTPLALGFAVTGESVRISNRADFVVDERAPGTEEYDPIVENAFVAPLAAPLSTFSIDVDTASYANVRRFITQHQLPPRSAVRVEELVNYFAYSYPQPEENRPVAVNVDVGRAPWRPEHRLVRIGLKAREIPRDRRPPSSLVFLVDVSGSMSSENKLPLVKRGLTLLTEQMTEGDRVAIVTYSDTATLRLDSTTGDNRKPILDTINSLQAAGSTNGAGGIQLAYRTAIDHFVDGGTNRVILCTDGDFNVGVSGDDELVQLIQDRARSKVFFSVFGFGMGNLKDGKLEKLADKGNGHYAYIDGQREAQKVFVDELASTLVTVAKDVKLQVEFNPARVGAYRLIGYENRALATQDFHDDRKDAGEMGAGHTVTALYEIAPADRFPAPPAGEALRYQRVGLAQAGEVGKELMSVRVRYKLPEADESSLFEVPVIDPLPQATIDGNERKDENAPQNAPSEPRPPRDFEWAAAVAAYGMVLRDSQYRGQAGLDMVLELAQGARGDDPTGRRQEFIDLVQQTKSIQPSLAATGALYLGVRAPAALTPQQAEERATVNGKYRNLLRIVPADSDATSYGTFRDFGHWEGTSYLGHDNLPRGYWVYVAPNWYIWGDGPKSDTIKK